MKQMLILVASLLLACGQETGASIEPPVEPPPAPQPELVEETPPAAPSGVEVPGFGGFLVPEGGSGGPPPHGGTSMVVYQYAMSPDALSAALRATMAANNWRIESDETSPRGSVRLSVTDGTTSLDVRVVGQGEQASAIITKR
ncbi:MAG: hypothetical protein ACI9KE_001106 [Polyangiales bacterium]|jgi:hypothetical protein